MLFGVKSHSDQPVDTIKLGAIVIIAVCSSGLNIVSEFNLDNLTEFGGESSNDLQDILVDKDEPTEEDLKQDAK
jgi:hypothetical protein